MKITEQEFQELYPEDTILSLPECILLGHGYNPTKLNPDTGNYFGYTEAPYGSGLSYLKALRILQSAYVKLQLLDYNHAIDPDFMPHQEPEAAQIARDDYIFWHYQEKWTIPPFFKPCLEQIIKIQESGSTKEEQQQKNKAFYEDLGISGVIETTSEKNSSRPTKTNNRALRSMGLDDLLKYHSNKNPDLNPSDLSRKLLEMKTSKFIDITDPKRLARKISILRKTNENAV